MIAHRDEIEGAPQAPPAARPITGFGRGRAAPREILEDVDERVGPHPGRPIHRIGQNRYGDISARQNDGAADATLEPAGMAKLPQNQAVALNSLNGSLIRSIH